MNNHDTSYYGGSPCRCRLESCYGRPLQRVSFCNEEQDRITIFRTLRYTRIRLHALRQYLPKEDASTRNMQGRFLDIAIGYINTELDLLHRYDTVQKPIQSESSHRWTGAIVELVELIYALHEVKRIDDGETGMNELAAFFGGIFGVKLDARYLYDAYTDIKQRKRTAAPISSTKCVNV